MNIYHNAIVTFYHYYAFYLGSEFFADTGRILSVIQDRGITIHFPVYYAYD